MEAALALASAWIKTRVIGWLHRNWPKLAGAFLLVLLACATFLGGAVTLLAGNSDQSEAATACTTLGYEVNQAEYQPRPVDQAPTILTGGDVAGFGAGEEELIANAKIIVAEGKAAGVGKQGMIVAIATALQESGLRNVDYGDRDSLGLFQQRPATGWGTPEQVRDPSYAARAFFGGERSPHYNQKTGRSEPPGLLEISGWQDMPVTVAAQKVQRSAFPDAYAKHEQRASTIVDALADGTPATPATPASPTPAGSDQGAMVTAADYRSAGIDIDAFCESNFELAAVSDGGGVFNPGQPIPEGQWTTPVQGPVTSVFGMRLHPVYGVHRLHAGIDFGVGIGTPIASPTAGVVEEVTWTSGGGLVVQVAHAGGISTRHLHLSEVKVKPGQQVDGGATIALSGDTGVGTAAHYHFEVHVNGDPVDPEQFMTQQGINLRAWS